MTELILIRGLPGSGKSTLAKKLQSRDTIHLEADMFFEADGYYSFDYRLLGSAHNWCLRTTIDALKARKSVVVSNTFTTIKELRPYFVAAKELGIVPTVIHCQNSFESVHAVPTETLLAMKNRFQHDISELYPC